MTRNQRHEAGCLLLMALASVALTLWLFDGDTPAPPPTSPLSPVRSATVAHYYLPAVFKPASNLVFNAGFEGGMGGTCSWYDAHDGQHTLCFIEQRVPDDWVFGWYENYGYPLCNDGVTGRPEAGRSDRTHEGDVYEGEYSAHAFTFWRCGRFWWDQEVETEPDNDYTISAWVRTWPSNDEMKARICVDFVCSDWHTTNGDWVHLSRTAHIEADSAVVSVECAQTIPNKNADCWFDNVALFKD